MQFDRRAFLAASAATAISSKALAQGGAVLRPEDFGARGDGIANDTRAFAALSAEVNRRGGGTISLASKRTYVVGGQKPGGPRFGWEPEPILDLHDLPGPVTILGNGARLRCEAGLRFGTFDPASGAPVRRAMPNFKGSEVASPYSGLIYIHACRGPITVRDVELDGNLERLRIGGPFGDTGWQIPATGLLLEGNLGEETVENVFTHHHGQDGAIIIGVLRRSGRSRFSHLVSRHNGRQGLSVTGGHGYDFADCEFSHTGRGAIYSAPGAGVDIEAEDQPIRDLSFTRCKFIDNAGVGMLADSGDSEGAVFTDCLFVGTTAWSAWPLKPRFSFDGCTFVGSVVHPFPNADPARAARFTRCHFTDDPKLSPNGKVYTGNGPIVDLAESDNVLFDGCIFRVVAMAQLPWSWRATYRDCVMTQRSPKGASTKGRYQGHTTISGPVDLYGSMVEGVLILNGKQIPRGPMGVPPW